MMECDWINEDNKKVPCEPTCTVTDTLQLFRGKWKVFILWQLNRHCLRFTDFTNLLPGVSKKVLSVQLKELEHDGLISRKVYPEVPPKVEYSITNLGKSLIPVMSVISEWGKHYADVNECLTDK